MNEVEYRMMYEAEDTHWWYVSLHALVLRSLPHSAEALRIFDAGCGTGRLMQLLSARGTVEGCDISDTALSFCRMRGLTAVTRADLNTASLDHDRYDVVTLIDVLYHAAVSDDVLVLKKIYAALKPGGILILQVPAYEWLRSSHDIAVHTGRRYTREQIMHKLRESGYSIERATYRSAFLLVPIVLVRLARKMLRCRTHAAPASDITRHSTVVNALLSAVMKAETRILKHRSLPFGTSVFAAARKPDAPCGSMG